MTYPKKDILSKYNPQSALQNDGIHYGKWVDDLEAPIENCYFTTINKTKDYIKVLTDVQLSKHKYFVFTETIENRIVFIWHVK